MFETPSGSLFRSNGTCSRSGRESAELLMTWNVTLVQWLPEALMSSAPAIRMASRRGAGSHDHGKAQFGMRRMYASPLDSFNAQTYSME